MAEQSNGTGNGRWQWSLSIIAAGAVIIGGLVSFFVQSASLSAQVSLNLSRIATLESTLSAANEHITQLRADMAATKSDLREVETQFCGSDIVRNLMHANDLRLFAILWHKLFPESTFPTDNSYYPQICNRNNGNNGGQGAN